MSEKNSLLERIPLDKNKDYQIVVKKMTKMRSIELGFKEFYEVQDRDFFCRPIETETFRKTIREGDKRFHHLLIRDISDILSEEMYFHDSQDISIFQHWRYLPAMNHEHDFFEVACVLSGTFENHIVKQTMDLLPGDICIIAPHTRHAVSAFDENAIMINILIRASTFENHFLNLLPKNDLLYNFFVKTLYQSADMPYLIFRTGEDPVMLDHILTLYQEYDRNNRYKSTMIGSQLSIFFVDLLRRHEQDVLIPTVTPSVMNEETMYILRYMQQNYTTITLSHLAEFFHYSERQIQRIISAATGQTFSENIRSLRMGRAVELLLESNLTIADISASLGYSDVGNFRKVFKKYYGVTPQEYREKNQLQVSLSLT